MTPPRRFADDERLYMPKRFRKNVAPLVHYLYCRCQNVVGGKDEATDVAHYAMVGAE